MTCPNFKAVTANGEAPYEELSASDLNAMNKYLKSFFKEIRKSCLALALFDIWFGTSHMAGLIDEIPQEDSFHFLLRGR